MPSILPPLPSLLLFLLLLLSPLPSPTRAASPFNLSKPDVFPLTPNLHITAVTDWFNVTQERIQQFADATLDLFWDSSGSVTFAKNHCKTSVPAGLCAHQEGK